MSPQTVTVDTLVVGSGPIGATFARRLVEAGRDVWMIDAGAQLSERPGAHLKNSFLYQRNIDLFAPVIRGHLHLLSVPPNRTPVVTLDPSAFQFDPDLYDGFVLNNQNPEQDPARNLGAAAACYAVGGMATHWTCATPRHHPTIERSELISDADWERLYGEGERLLGTHTDAFAHSVRHQVVRNALATEFTELPAPYQVQNLPLAVRRREDNPGLVHWSGTDTVLGPLADGEYAGSGQGSGKQGTGRFRLSPEHLCTRLFRSADGSRVEYAEVQNLQDWSTVRVEADTFVVACNAVLTPQLLFASHIRPEALGRYLNEQPVTFCQIVLDQGLIDGVERDARFEERVRAHRKRMPNDPVPIPMDDPEPNVWIPVSEGRPWHCQIHRDAFHYGEVAPNVDTRLIVDLRWFGITEPRWENRVTFSEAHVDSFGMPQPTFDFAMSAAERRTQHLMMKDMLRAAGTLGGFLPGSEPRFVEPGLPLHFAGTTRMGESADTSVVDVHSRVWGIDNLYLGGNGIIPRGQASNPTLTSVAVAIKAAEHILAGSGASRSRSTNGSRTGSKTGSKSGSKTGSRTASKTGAKTPAGRS
jgi:pyranose oxidase